MVAGARAVDVCAIFAEGAEDSEHAAESGTDDALVCGAFYIDKVLPSDAEEDVFAELGHHSDVQGEAVIFYFGAFGILVYVASVVVEVLAGDSDNESFLDEWYGCGETDVVVHLVVVFSFLVAFIEAEGVGDSSGKVGVCLGVGDGYA